jgi:hypothetical protein
MPKQDAKVGIQLTVPQHFYRPSGAGHWYVRLVAPRHLQTVVGKVEYRRSTGQSDLRRAKPIGMALIASQLREWDSLGRALSDPASRSVPTVLTAELIDQICAARLYSWMTSDDAERFGPGGLDEAALAEIDRFCQLSDQAMRSVLSQGPASPRWSDVVEDVTDWCETMGYRVDPADPMFTNLVRSFAQVEREAQARIDRRNRGEGASTPEPPKIKGQRLSEVIGPFTEYKRARAGDQYLSTIANAWKLLIDHCGDIPFDSVSPRMLFEFFEARLHAKVKPWSEARARNFGTRVIGEIFGYARTMGMMSQVNPVDRLEAFPTLDSAEEATRRSPRFPYSTEHINTLFASEWYDPTESRLFTGKMREDLGARYWVPLIGICHGTRVRESLQLVASDFKYSGQTLTMQIRAEIDDQIDESKSPNTKSNGEGRALSFQDLRSIKTDSTARIVPVFPKLIELGFEDFVNARRATDGANALLFPSSMPNLGGKSPKIGRAYEQGFLRFVRDHLKFGSGLGNHGLRHQLEDRIRDTQARKGMWPPGMTQQYTGRKRVRSGDRDVSRVEGSESEYGFGYSPSAMIEYISRIDFSDLRFPVKFTDWIKKNRKLRVDGSILPSK